MPPEARRMAAEGEEADAAVGQVVGDREEAGEEAGVVAADLVGQTRVGADDEQAERLLELTQRGLGLTLAEPRVAAEAVRHAAPEAPAFDGGDDRRDERTGEQHDQAHAQCERDGQEYDSHDQRRHLERWSH